MGCCSSNADAVAPEEAPPLVKEATAVSDDIRKTAQERLSKLEALDKRTKVPFILVELTGETHGKGDISVCGKDEYGVFEALNSFFVETWGCTEEEQTDIKLCGMQFDWPGYTVSEEGVTNLSKSIMQLVDFMCGKLSWTLAVVSSGSFAGDSGDSREMQVIFKAPHPMNLVTSHIMLELNASGHIQVCADICSRKDDAVLDVLHQLLQDRFQAEDVGGLEEFCDKCYRVEESVFPTSNYAGNRFGIMSAVLCDCIVQVPGWSLAASLGGTPWGSEHREQQLVFRKDHHPLGDSFYVTVVINEGGKMEVNGKDVREVVSKLQSFLEKELQCQELHQVCEDDGTLCIKYTWNVQDLLTTDAQIIKFFEMQGFETQVCTQYVVNVDGNMVREQQLLFRPGKTDVGTVEPHLILSMFAGEGNVELYEDPEQPTQVLARQSLSLAVVQPEEGSAEVDKALSEIDSFVIDFLGGSKASASKYHLDVFMSRGWYENNLSQWTMRLCDFITDHLGWSLVTCSLCNTGDHGHFREQQLIFHYEGEKRDVPVANSQARNLSAEEWKATPMPDYWTSQDVLEGRRFQETVSCTEDEIRTLQEMCDSTFKRILTRDRVPDDDAPESEEMPYRLEVLHAFRSENAWLHHCLYTKVEESAIDEPFEVKTSIDSFLTQRLEPGVSYLFHGTNPSSAMSIMRTGFLLDHAGKTTGTMLGYGVYLSERASKADEYAADDGGNTYPGVRALLVCRSFVGRPLVVHQAGDYIEAARASSCDCICGDREKTAGTYREFVFFETTQVYPEFVVIYRRQYDPKQVPASMREPTTGTTGRFWQFRGDIFGFKGWKNVPPEVNKQLQAAHASGLTKLSISLRGHPHEFDIAEKSVKNPVGKMSPLRPPMVSS
mmetsp:Transcript_67467/g.161876  ORF Transcript_67467/g.161876 Transcript_67467/m.161876 type:complete len:889 (-) Transcript_67467:124-2790(-)